MPEREAVVPLFDLFALREAHFVHGRERFLFGEAKAVLILFCGRGDDGEVVEV